MQKGYLVDVVEWRERGSMAIGKYDGAYPGNFIPSALLMFQRTVGDECFTSGGSSATNVLLDVARQEGGVPLAALRVANSPEGARGGPNSSI